MMQSTLIQDKQQSQVNTRFQHEKGAWFQWLAEEQQERTNGDAFMTCADPRACQVSTSATQMLNQIPMQKVPTQNSGDQHVSLHAGASELKEVCLKGAQHVDQGLNASEQQVVWCHEHCHKGHNAARKKMLSSLCCDYGVALVCHKKAAKVEAWLNETVKPNYILLTDWREAKPCMKIDILREKALFTDMIVYCETEQTFRKASEWARSLTLEVGNVHVVRTTSDLDALLAKVLSKQSQQQKPAPMTPSTVSDVGSDHQETDTEAECSNESPPQVLLTTSMVRFWPMCSPIVVSAPVLNPICSPIVASAPVVNPVSQVLGPLLSCYSAQQLTQVLQQAMPECYTD